MQIVGLIPAAGRAVRLQPLDRSKEMLDVGGRPVFEYLVDRMWVGGAHELRVVTRPEKTDVAEAAAAAGSRVIFARPATVSESIALALEGLESDDIALLGFPDTIWSPADGFRRLVDVLADEGVDGALGLFRTPGL